MACHSPDSPTPIGGAELVGNPASDFVPWARYGRLALHRPAGRGIRHAEVKLPRSRRACWVSIYRQEWRSAWASEALILTGELGAERMVILADGWIATGALADLITSVGRIRCTPPLNPLTHHG